MNCTDARAVLPLHVYGDLPPADAAALDAHLQGCAACRAEHAALRRVRGLLDAVPPADAAVDPARIYREAALQDARRLRRWRRAALAAGAAAAALLALAVLPRLEARVEAGQLVVRWGPAPAPTEQPPPAPPAPATVVRDDPAAHRELRDVREQLRIVSELLQDLAADVHAGDDRRRREVARLQAEVDALRDLSARQWNAAEQDIGALSAPPPDSARKGANP